MSEQTEAERGAAELRASWQSLGDAARDNFAAFAAELLKLSDAFRQIIEAMRALGKWYERMVIEERRHRKHFTRFAGHKRWPGRRQRR